MNLMWHDNETERDFLNFTGESDTVAEIIVQASGRPISIGVSGAWGVYCKIRGDDGALYILRLDEKRLAWSLTLFTSPKAQALVPQTGSGVRSA
jgi:hypothetical protein